ncbi:hypothetical protein CYMTET_28316 [Cymbomonas tetramitiformis]|uniref:Uncharacterized protein n=1 Tax=Cymbomonas tetramitiformis TaxID=36881 RepID=A0AAE0FN27_9CHLO|nr:hypothetical protein CYMTET_28316 [Cymbomonas tetramitiformis]
MKDGLQSCSHPLSNQETCQLSSETWEAVLLTDLFGTDEQIWNGTAPYSASARPVTSPSHPVRVDITLWRLIPSLVDDSKEILYGQLGAAFRWEDPFLRWDPAQYDGLNYMSLTDTTKFWIPDIMVDNSLGNFADAPAGSYGVNVHAGGKISLNMPISFSVICRLNVADFPFDKQNCEIVLVAWSFQRRGLVEFTQAFMYPTEDLGCTNSAWTFTKVTLRVRAKCWQEGVGNSQDYFSSFEAAHSFYGDATYDCSSQAVIDLAFERHTQSIVSMSIIPTAVVTGLTFITFMLPISGGERTGLIITAFLAVVAVMFVNAEKLPDTDQVTILDKFNKGMMMINILVMVEAGIASMLADYRREVDVQGSWLLLPLYPEVYLTRGYWSSSQNPQPSRFWTKFRGWFPKHAIFQRDIVTESAEVPSGNAWKDHPFSAKNRRDHFAKELEGVLIDLNLEGFLEPLLQEHLDLPALAECNEAHLKQYIGLSFGQAIRLKKAANQRCKVDRLFPVNDVLDRISMVIFPIVYCIVLHTILGDHLSLFDIMKGMLH